jgi:hypothetical protein
MCKSQALKIKSRKILISIKTLILRSQISITFRKLLSIYAMEAISCEKRSETGIDNFHIQLVVKNDMALELNFS